MFFFFFFFFLGIEGRGTSLDRIMHLHRALLSCTVQEYHLYGNGRWPCAFNGTGTFFLAWMLGLAILRYWG